MLAIIYLELGDPDRAEFWFKRSFELAPSPYWLNAANEILHYYRGEKTEAAKYGRELLTMDPKSIYTLAHLRNYDLPTGRYSEARARYERAYPELLRDDEPAINDINSTPAIDLALVLAGTGEQKRADLLLDRTLTFLQTSSESDNEHSFQHVLIYALQGETDAALAALRHSIDQGWRTNWWFYLKYDPNLDSIRGEPGFQAMVEEIKDDMATQLKRVRAMDASGELTPIPDIS